MPGLVEILSARRTELDRLTMRLRHLFRAKSLARTDHCVDMLSDDDPIVLEGKTRTVWDLSSNAYYHLAWHGLCWDFGNESTLRYFLPRLMLDWITNSGPVDAEMFARGLGTHPWQKWSSEEVQVISDCLEFIWDTTSRSSSSFPSEFQTTVRCFALLKLDVISRVDSAVEDIETRPAYLTWLTWCDGWWRKSHDFAYGWGNEARPELTALQRFLLSPEFRQRLETKFMQVTEPTLSATVAYVIDTLERIARVRPAHLSHLFE